MASNDLARMDAVTMTRSLLEEITDRQADVASRYMPTLTPKQFTDREKLIQEFREMLVEGIDYGVIPGTEKPTLLQPGAQKVCAYFGYVPRYRFDVAIEDWTGEQYNEPLFYYRLCCELEKDGKRVGEGLGSCSSWESKYRYRMSKRTCPSCGAAALIEGRQWKPADPKQWVCYEKKGGCKAKFAIDDERITGQSVGRVANEDFADVINTVLKIGKKRAYIDATLSATGLSQYFTQDVEDHIDTGGAPANTQQAADNVAKRKIENGTPPELKHYFTSMDAQEQGSLSAAFNFVQDQLITVAGKDGETIFFAHSGQLRNRHPKGTPIPVGEAKGTLLILWGEVLRLRAEREKRMKDEADSAYAVSQ